MEISTILYFCNSYLIMLDYEEELKDVINDFKKKETDQKNTMLKKECDNILTANEIDRNTEIKRIIEESIDLDIEISEMQDILECIYQNI